MRRMNRIAQLFFLLTVLSSCKKNEELNLDVKNHEFISAVDISSYPEISNSNPSFYNLEGNENNFLSILKENGVNTIRVRLWVNPRNENSGFNQVNQLSNTLKQIGFKTWLTVHYSDTWADPSHQETPNQWDGISFSQLKDSVYNYTKKIMKELQPDYIQIGNEINSGFIHPHGNISNNFHQFIELMDTAIKAVRENSIDAKIILHFAGIKESDLFYRKVNTLDYDIIGLSYYPIWHGKSIDYLITTMKQLSVTYKKQVLIAETAYPFTLEWNDWTNNIVGSNDHLILPEYPATKEGQRNFIRDLTTSVRELDNGIGICYWGAELISWKGNQAINASPWENQAIFDFNNKALPVLMEF